VTTGDHTTYRDEVGAYLLGALSDAERASFEEHLAGCPECREELERLRPAADLLPRSVEQVEPPASLKRSLMEVVEREAVGAAGGARAPKRRPLAERLRGRWLRPALVPAAILLAIAVGFAAGRLGGDEERTLQATVNPIELPDAGGRLQLEGDGQDGAILRVQGMPSLTSRRVYQAWVERDGMVQPEQTFEVGADGGGAVAVPDDLSDADAVHVTREPRGGSRAPSEQPILTVRL
jgi:anti-sigma-K factor RskA